MEPKMEQKDGCRGCTHCKARAEKEAQHDEMALAILIMLMPAMTLTMFSNMGLF